jgi:hypothetical protein
MTTKQIIVQRISAISSQSVIALHRGTELVVGKQPEPGR